MIFKRKIKAKKIIAILLALMIMGLSILRENLFLELNAILSGENVNRANFYLFYDFLISYPKDQLFQLKIVLTFVFIVKIALLNYFVVLFWFCNSFFNKITIISQLILITLLLLGVLLSKMLGVYPDIYFVFRKITGFLQSPIPLFMLVSLFSYFEITKSK
ncbi:MAG: hypothetical protein P1U41_08395 [Vicingaceae bacterium]|nr:hypothetical protein [Vicingaceae bacterium]